MKRTDKEEVSPVWLQIMPTAAGNTHNSAVVSPAWIFYWFLPCFLKSYTALVKW